MTRVSDREHEDLARANAGAEWLGTRFPSRGLVGDANISLDSSHHPVFDAAEQIAYRLDLAACHQLIRRLSPEVLVGRVQPEIRVHDEPLDLLADVREFIRK
jgi:hypothetical protein